MIFLVSASSASLVYLFISYLGSTYYGLDFTVFYLFYQIRNRETTSHVPGHKIAYSVVIHLRPVVGRVMRQSIMRFGTCKRCAADGKALTLEAIRASQLVSQ